MGKKLALAGKIALVTGASRGLGYALSKDLGIRGAHVVALARTVGSLEQLEDDIVAEGGSATLVPLDLQDAEGIARLSKAIAERWGKLDILAHCAVHPTPLAPIVHSDLEQFDQCFAVGPRGLFLLLRLIHPLLAKADKAKIVIFKDRHTGKFSGVQKLSKVAEQSLVKCYIEELSGENIELHICEPPPMQTSSRARMRPGEDKNFQENPFTFAQKLSDSIFHD